MASSSKNPRASHPGSWSCMCCRVCNMWCWRAFKWLPVLMITGIIIWSYYAYVIQLCIFTVENTVQKCIYLVVYHFLLIMFFWSYCQTIFAVIQPVPDKFKLPETELEKLLTADSEDAQRSIIENFSKDLPLVTRLITLIRTFTMKVGYNFAKKETRKDIIEHHANKVHVLTRTPSGSVRYCNRCVLIKPDRAHHCSICARCVLKMDHHCPWVNNCVCYFNYKFFMLFLGYALVYCLFIMATTLPYFVKFWRKIILIPVVPIALKSVSGEFGVGQNLGTYHVLFAFFVSLMFGVSLGSLFGYHCFLVANNRTTLEAFRAPMFRGGADKNGFSLGYYNNFKEVFGNVPQLWFIPVFTSLGDGCSFPVRREHQLQTFTTPQETHGYESMGTTRSSFGDGIVYPLPDQEEDTESLLSSERWDRWGDRARPFDERESSSYDEL